MKKEMLINVLQPEEIRIAILENGILEELYVERTSHESFVGNIYKGRIVNIEPSIQAAFVDFGVGRNGFLHVSDVEPAYYRDMPGYGDGSRRSPRDRGRSEGPRPGGRDQGRDRGRDRDRDQGRRASHLPPQTIEEVHIDEEVEILDTPLVTDELADEAPAVSGEPMERPWPQDAMQPLPSASEEDDESDGPWERSEESLEEREESLEEEIPSAVPLGDTDPIMPTHTSEPADESEPVEADAETEEKAEGSEKPKRRGGRGRKPRVGKKRRGKDDPEGDVMPAAERRTDEHTEATGSLDSPRDLSDDDLSFSARPRSEKKPTPPPARHEAPPQRQPEPPRRAPEPPRRAPEATLSFPEDEGLTFSAPVSGARETLEDDDGGLTFSPPPSPAAPTANDEMEVELIEEEWEPEITELPGREPPAPFQRPQRDEPETDEQAPPRPVHQDEEEEEYHPAFDDFESGPPRRNERNDRGDRRGGGGRDRGDRRGGGREGGRDRGRRGPGSFGGRPGMSRPKPLIQDIFKRGQEVLVQVIKDGIGTKGPTLSTYISIAGRYLVLMPGLNRIGVSRKIEDEDARRRLRVIMNELEPPKGLGFIVRTAGVDRETKELQRDLLYLARLWRMVVRRIKKLKSPVKIYQESDMVTRTIRDIFTSDIESIWVDEQGAYESAKEFMEVVMPRHASRIKLWDSPEPMFHRHGIEQEIARIQQRRIELPMGGSIVIDQTEALVAIDVNSGSFRADNNNAEETAYRMNLQAAKEIGRQLRLRDLGGVIVNDFIDMRDEKHRRNVERALRDAIARDRARTKVLRISQFGIIEMTRQRIRPSLKRSVYKECPHCKGTSQVKTTESMSIDVMRLLQLAVSKEHFQSLEVRVHEEVADYLLNRKRLDIARLEETGKKQITVRGQASVAPEHLVFQCFDGHNNPLNVSPLEEPPRLPDRRRGGHR